MRLVPKRKLDFPKRKSWNPRADIDVLKQHLTQIPYSDWEHIKSYVDTADALRLTLTGGTLSGDLTVADTVAVKTGTAVDDYYDLEAYDTTGTTRYPVIRVQNNSSAAVKLGLWGVAAAVRQNHIIDADGQLADITTKFNTLLAQLETVGVLKTS